jgi:iron complex transport system substrate-binding protein
MLFALGFGDQVVAVTHECDWPAETEGLPKVTYSNIPEGLEPAAIDRAVKESVERGEALYGLDREILSELEPDLIVAQDVCAVCAVSFDDVRTIAAGMPGEPHVLSQDPTGLADVLGDATRLAEAVGEPEAGHRLKSELENRLDRVRNAVNGLDRPAVLALEWLDPPFTGGHWVPEMIELAGGRDLLGQPGEKSREVDPGDLAGLAPDLAIVMPCGYDCTAAAAEATARRDLLVRIAPDRTVAVDACASFSRPGPRLVDGAELLAFLLHPEAMEEPGGLDWQEIT